MVGPEEELERWVYELVISVRSTAFQLHLFAGLGLISVSTLFTSRAITYRRSE